MSGLLKNGPTSNAACTGTADAAAAPDDARAAARPRHASTHRRRLSPGRPRRRRARPRVRVLQQAQGRKVRRVQLRLYRPQSHLKNSRRQSQPSLPTSTDRRPAEALTGSHKHKGRGKRTHRQLRLHSRSYRSRTSTKSTNARRPLPSTILPQASQCNVHLGRAQQCCGRSCLLSSQIDQRPC